MSPYTDNTWDRILSTPIPPLQDLASEFPGYTFNSSGWDKEMADATGSSLSLDTLHTPTQPMPSIDITTLSCQAPMTINPLTVLGTQQTPSPMSCFVLSDLNTFPPFNPDLSTTEHPPICPDNLRVAADRKRVRNREKAAGWQAQEAEGEHSCGNDLIMIVHTIVDVNPHIAPYGKKGAAWQQVVAELQSQNSRHKSLNAVTVQHKAEAFIGYKKDPNGKYKNMLNIIGDDKSASITIGALLERMETQYNKSKDKSDDAKAKLKKKNDADREGGEAIQQASMQTLRRKCACSPSTSGDDSDITVTITAITRIVRAP
ncbi:hypothetical protein B0H10DRAFT_2209528 [Mycena sp. CBHHK59/15]|nr:hypothetical protein B0H10DRAFT_2209528 [Mycena sp. CBHHK59/15]